MGGDPISQLHCEHSLLSSLIPPSHVHAAQNPMGRASQPDSPSLGSGRDPILYPWEWGEADPAPAVQGRGTPLLPLHPHQPGLAAELRPCKQAAQAPAWGYPSPTGLLCKPLAASGAQGQELPHLQQQAQAEHPAVRKGRNPSPGHHPLPL